MRGQIPRRYRGEKNGGALSELNADKVHERDLEGNASSG